MATEVLPAHGPDFSDLGARVDELLEAIAHLEHLATDGTLIRTAADGMVVFSRASQNGCAVERPTTEGV
jgi:hypothetical protein